MRFGHDLVVHGHALLEEVVHDARVAFARGEIEQRDPYETPEGLEGWSTDSKGMR